MDIIYRQPRESRVIEIFEPERVGEDIIKIKETAIKEPLWDPYDILIKREIHKNKINYKKCVKRVIFLFD